MFEELFSKRYSLRPTPEGLIFEDIPHSARIGLFYILEDFLDNVHVQLWHFYSNICMALRIPRATRDYYLQESELIPRAIENLIMDYNWWQVYDICELMYRELTYIPYRQQLSKQINKLFIDEQLGFEMREGAIEKVGSGFIDAQVKEARYLLKEPEFKGADEHFEKAIKALNVRPNPDVENCIKDAVAAIESVARIIVNDDKALLSNIIKDMANKGIIPKPLDQAIQKIYAYRGDQPGVAHGLVGASKVTIDEAEFVLAMSAAIIIYLVKKRGKV